MPKKMSEFAICLLKNCLSFVLRALIMVQIVSLAACYYNVDVKDKSGDASKVANQVD